MSNEYDTPRLRVFSFGPFEPPSKRKNDTNDIPFESPDIGLLESKTKLGLVLSYTVNVLVAKTATFTSVTCPVALWMQLLQSMITANFCSQICNFNLQTLQILA